MICPSLKFTTWATTWTVSNMMTLDERPFLSILHLHNSVLQEYDTWDIFGMNGPLPSLLLEDIYRPLLLHYLCYNIELDVQWRQNWRWQVKHSTTFFSEIRGSPSRIAPQLGRGQIQRFLSIFVRYSNIFSPKRFQFLSPPRRNNSRGCGSLQSAKQFMVNSLVRSS